MTQILSLQDDDIFGACFVLYLIKLSAGKGFQLLVLTLATAVCKGMKYDRNVYCKAF